MRVRKQRSLLVVLLLNLIVSLPPAIAQQNVDAAEQAKRQRAMALFGEGKRLEALPLLEELAEKNPQDSEILVALAASLIEHAATLSDANAAAKARFRARDLVQRAWALGNQSPLAENLRQLLEELPVNGAIQFSDNAAVQQAMAAGEAAFARRDFDQALKDYAKALELEPGNYPAALFTGNAYDRKNDLAKAAECYERAIRINPNVETAYRYYADMLAKEGEMAKARTLLIRAAVAEPYNRIVWREIRAWATINNTAVNVVYVGVPRLSKDDATRSAKQAADVSAAWRAYYAVKTEWQKGGKFEKEFPREAEYRHSLAEESEALNAAAKVLEELKQDKKSAELMAADAATRLLLKLHEAGLIEPYVLFSLGDEGIAKDYIAYRAKSRGKLEEYMDKFVVPPAPAKP
jgi:tetratricopeptide (TPR) repeat protein